MKGLLRALLIALTVFAIIFAACQSQHFTGAKVYMQQNNWEKAIEQLQIEVTNNPVNAEAWWLLGNCYLKEKKYLEMNEAFAKCVEIDPTREKNVNGTRHNEWVPYYNSAINAMNAGKHDEAKEKLDKAIVIYESKPGNYVNYGILFLNLENLDAAIEKFDKALSIIGDDLKTKEDSSLYITSMKNKAAIYINQKKNDEAMEIYLKILEITPEDVNIIANLAACYDEKKEYDKSEEYYNKATELEPDNKNLWFNIGISYFQNKKNEKAEEAFNKVIALDPEDKDALFNLALIYNIEKKWLETIEVLEKLVEINPEDPEYWNLLGVAYINTGQKEKGAEAFEKQDELTNKQKTE